MRGSRGFGGTRVSCLHDMYQAQAGGGAVGLLVGRVGGAWTRIEDLALGMSPRRGATSEGAAAPEELDWNRRIRSRCLRFTPECERSAGRLCLLVVLATAQLPCYGRSIPFLERIQRHVCCLLVLRF